jgi:hypothetical protein
VIADATQLITDALRHSSDGVRALLPRLAVDDPQRVPEPVILGAHENSYVARGIEDPDVGPHLLMVQPFDSGRGTTVAPTWSPGARDVSLELQICYRAAGPTVGENWLHASAVLRVALWSLARLFRSTETARRVANGVQLVDCRSGWIWPIVTAESDPTVTLAFGLLVLVRDTTPYGPGGS